MTNETVDILTGLGIHCRSNSVSHLLMSLVCASNTLKTGLKCLHGTLGRQEHMNGDLALVTRGFAMFGQSFFMRQSPQYK